MSTASRRKRRFWRGRFGVVLARAGQAAAGQRGPGDRAYAFGGAEREHLAFFFAVEEIVVILHGNELGPASGALDTNGFHELPGVHGGGAQVADFASADHFV